MSEPKSTQAFQRYRRLANRAVQLLQKAPWVTVSSLAAGLGNYLIVLLLFEVSGAEAAGTYRYLLAIFYMLGLLTLVQCRNVLVREIVVGNEGTVRTILKWRFYFGLGALACGLALALMFHFKNNAMAPLIAGLSFFVPIFFVSETFVSINIARHTFRRNAIYVLIRQVLTVSAVAYAIVIADMPADYVVILWAAVMSLTGLVFITIEARPFYKAEPSGFKPVRDSIAVSTSQLAVDTLEHIDKFAIAAVAGLGVLGEYALGVSTGRLLYFLLKPLQLVLSRHMVKNNISAQHVMLVAVSGTILGLVCAALLYVPFRILHGDSHELAYHVAMIVLVGAGLYSAGQLVFNGSILNERSSVKVPVVTNILAPAILLASLGLVYLLAPDWLVYAFAAALPLRYALFIVLIRIANHFLLDKDLRKVSEKS